jgi:hypothetical protein
VKKGSFFKWWYFTSWFFFNQENIWLNQVGGWKGQKLGVSHLNRESWQVCRCDYFRIRSDNDMLWH